MENFGQLLVLEATGDRSLVSLTEPPRYWNYFQGEHVPKWRLWHRCSLHVLQERAS